MRRVLVVFSIFLLGFGSSQLVSFFLSQNRVLQTSRIREVSQEATSASMLEERALEEYARVVRVIDGDTIEIEGGKRVRYIGIDTPETVDPRKSLECFGREATAENKRMVEGISVRLEKDVSETDAYGRLLRYVFVDQVFINDHLVRQGFAHAVTYPPDVRYQNQFRQAEQEARENKRGLWAGCVTDTPLTIQQYNNATIAPVVDRGNENTCSIKGNISTNGERIYHLPGCGSYDKTSIDESKGEKWFCTEDEAQKAGWRKAKNC